MQYMRMPARQLHDNRAVWHALDLARKQCAANKPVTFGFSQSLHGILQKTSLRTCPTEQYICNTTSAGDSSLQEKTKPGATLPTPTISSGGLLVRLVPGELADVAEFAPLEQPEAAQVVGDHKS